MIGPTGKMQMLSVRVENIKGCSLAEVKVNKEGLTIVGGLNGNGKSSFLDGICMALGGKRLFPPEPLREGQLEAEVMVRLSGGTEWLPWPCEVRRTIERKEDGTGITTKVVIISEDGDKANEPQTLLDSIMGSLSFDPLAFVSQSPKEQVNTLRDLVGIDFTEIDATRQDLYEDRTKINRVAKQLDGKLKQTPIHDDVPSEKISVRDLMGRLEKVEQHNAAVNRKKQDIDSAGKKLADVVNRIARLHADQKQIEDWIAKAQEDIEPLVDVEPIRKAMVDSEEINRKLDENAARLDLYTEKKNAERESSRLTKAIEEIDKQKRKMASEAQWPIEGLGFSSDGVVYNGVPFVQLASSEQLEVSVAISMSLNKAFPFAIVRAGSLLDDERLEELAAVVEKHKGQCFVERVSTGPECHVVFEEGRRVR